MSIIRSKSPQAEVSMSRLAIRQLKQQIDRSTGSARDYLLLQLEQETDRLNWYARKTIGKVALV